MIEFVPARLVHCGPIAANMREMDRRECAALGRSPKEALRGGLRCSLSAFTALEGGRPQAMFGVVPDALMGGRGTVWFLGTEGVFRHGRELLTYGPLFVASWLETFASLSNIIMVENVKAIRLLERWGFVIEAKVQMRGGEAFVPFRIERAAIQERSLAA